MNNAIIELFKGYIPSTEQSTKPDIECLRHGIIIADNAPNEIKSYACSLYGIHPERWNETLHKSWSKVATASDDQLFFEQVMHYITTYGFESLGCYSSNTVYIPLEELNIPELNPGKCSLTYIKPMRIDEVTEKLEMLVNSGIALSEFSLKNIDILADLLDKAKFDQIKNREVRAMLYKKYGMVPQDPDEFLRYLIYELTGETLKIQSKEMLRGLKAVSADRAVELIKQYGDYDKLSSIFLRNKNIFLSLKKPTRRLSRDKQSAVSVPTPEINTIVNKLRKLANKNHKPMPSHALDMVTSGDVQIDRIVNELEKVSTFRLLKMYNSLLYRLSDDIDKDVVYRIRNGKSFVDKIAVSDEQKKNMKNVVAELDKQLAGRLGKLAGKKVYIPEGMVYTVPTTEKQFVGNIPEGSMIELADGEDIIFGIHWNNTDQRVDLDLHMTSADCQFGWNSFYRNEGCDILYSGDVTDACGPNGATEAFSIASSVKDGAYMVTINKYSGSLQVPFEFVIAKGKLVQGQEEYVIDPNNIIAKFDFEFNNNNQITLGMVKNLEHGKRFIFNNYALGYGIVTIRSDYIVGAYRYMDEYNKYQLRLNDLLKFVGAEVTSKHDDDIDYDLSFENIDKATIIGLFAG